MALKGMERTTLGITAGLAILAAAIQYLHPHSGHVSHGVSLCRSGGPSRPIYCVPARGRPQFLSAKAQELRTHSCFCLLAYRMYAALRKPRCSLQLDLSQQPDEKTIAGCGHNRKTGAHVPFSVTRKYDFLVK